jgi:multidrug efflux pump subunit AcrA (membrane-fusion protein)
LVVGPDNKVAERFVTLGQATPDHLRVIKSGLAPGDRFIVNGLMRARPGQKVNPQAEGDKPVAPAKPGAPSSASR